MRHPSKPARNPYKQITDNATLNFKKMYGKKNDMRKCYNFCHSTCEVALGKRYRMQNFTDIPFIYAKIQPVTKYVTRSRRMLYLCAVAGKKHWPRLDTCRKFDPE